MINLDALFSEEDREFMKLFATMTHPDTLTYEPDSGRYLCGVFFSSDEEYNGNITSFMDTFLRLYLYLLLKGENEEVYDKIKKVHNAFISFLKRSSPVPQIKELLKIAPLSLKWEPFDEKGSRFKSYVATDAREGDVCIYYLDTVDEVQNGIEAKERILDALLSLNDLDEEVKEFLQYLKSLNKEESNLEKYLFERLWKVETSLSVGVGEETVVGSLKPIIVRLGYFPTRLSPKEFVKRLMSAPKVREEFCAGDEEDCEEDILKVLREEGHIKWIKKVYEDEEFLGKMRQALRRLLSEMPKPVSKICFRKEETKYFNGAVKKLDAKPFYALLVAEIGVLKRAKNFLEEALKFDLPYLRVRSLSDGKLIKALAAEKLFPSWKILVERPRYHFEGEDAYQFTAFLLEVGAFLEALNHLQNMYRRNCFLFFALDTNLEEEEGSSGTRLGR